MSRYCQDCKFSSYLTSAVRHRSVLYCELIRARSIIAMDTLPHKWNQIKSAYVGHMHTCEHWEEKVAQQPSEGGSDGSDIS